MNKFSNKKSHTLQIQNKAINDQIIKAKLQLTFNKNNDETDDFNKVADNILRLISKRIKDLRHRPGDTGSGLSRIEILSMNPSQVSNICNFKKTRRYPNLLGKNIINDLINNPKLPFKNRNELLWGINGHKEVNWGKVADKSFKLYMVQNLNKPEVKRILMGCIPYAVINAKYAFCKKYKHSLFRSRIMQLNILKYQSLKDYTIQFISIYNPLIINPSDFKKDFIKYFQTNNKHNPLSKFHKKFFIFVNKYFSHQIMKGNNLNNKSLGIKAYSCIFHMLKFNKVISDKGLLPNSNNQENKAYTKSFINKYDHYVKTYVEKLNNLQISLEKTLISERKMLPFLPLDTSKKFLHEILHN